MSPRVEAEVATLFDTALNKFASLPPPDRRVLPRNQIHWDKWPTELEKCGPFQKIWGPSELPIDDINGFSAFRQVEKDLETPC